MKIRKALLRALALVLIFVMLMCPSVSLGTVYANTDEAVPESSSATEPLAEGIVSSGGNQAKALAEEATSAGEDVVTTGNGDAAGPAEETEPKDEVQSKSSGSEPVTDSVTDDVKDEGTEQPEEQSNDSDSGDSAAPALRAAAEEGDAEDPEVFTYTTSNSKITITGYTGTDPVVVIPATIGDVPVTAIKASAFSGNTDITEVTIPYGITSIGNNAFANCTSLQTVNFNAEISSSFGNTVFSGCTALTVVNFGENVSSVWRNSSNAHYGPAVQEFNVAEANPNLKSIDGVLYNKYNSNSTDFDRLSLYPVAKEDKSFTIPDGIKYTGSNAFANNKFLEEVTLPYGMVSLGENTFYNCTSLAILNYNCQLGNMDSNVFEGCTSLATVNVGKDVKSIHRNTTNTCYGPAVQAFNVDPANTNLKSVDGVIYAKSSDDSTDYDALCLYPVAKEDTSYTVPESINYLYGNCISGNSYLEEVTILAKDAKGPYSSSTLLNSLPSLKTFRFPVSMRFNYSTVNNVPALEKLSITEGTPDTEVISYITTSTSISGSFEIEIGKGVTNIDISPFVNSVSSYTVDPENDVFFLGEEGALYRHISNGINGGTADPSGSETELVDIPIQAEITEFTPLNTTTLIRSITNKKVQKIDLSGLSQYLFARKSSNGIDLSYATMNCSALEEIDLGSGMINVPSFRMDAKLAALHLFPSENTDLDSTDYFYGCNSLKVLELAGNITSFDLTTSLPVEDLALGENVNVEDFRSTTKLKTIKVADSNEHLTSADGVLFNKSMSTLICYPTSKEGDSYTIPTGVTRIEQEAFYANKYLTELVIPDTVTSIGSGAFYDMEKMFTFRIPASVTEIGNSVVDTYDAYYTFIGKRNSAAHKYADANSKINFIDEDELAQADPADNECFNEATADTWDGTAEAPVVPVGKTYVIETAEQLAWVASQVNDNGVTFAGCNIVLAADLDMDGLDWTPIGSGKWFSGSFDGQNHTISNLTVSKTASTEGGLFGKVDNITPGTTTEFKNVVFDLADINRGAKAGVLMGHAYAAQGANVTIDRVVVKANCSVAGTTTGGIVATLDAGRNMSLITISNCRMLGEVHSDNAPCGGILGSVSWASGSGRVLIVDTSMYGDVKGHKYSMWKDHPDPGGIVGHSGTPSTAEGFIIRHCLSGGSVWTDFSAGAGGIAGILGANSVVEKTANFSDVTGGGYSAGGIAGENKGTIRECFNMGKAVTGTVGANGYGGLAGTNGGTIFNSYTFGETVQAGSALSYGGGICARNSGVIENCYVGSDLPISFINTAIAATGVGAVASLVGGTTTHTYFVDTGDPEHPRYMFAKYEKTGIIDDPDNNITGSGGMTLSDMRVPANFVNWDFDTVWEIDDQYSNGMPTLRSVKDLLRRMPKDAGTQNGPQCIIKVVDENDDVVEGATVTFNEETQDTDMHGSAYFTYTKKAVALEVTKDGYSTYSNSSFKMTPTREYVVRLISNDGLKDHPLSSVIMTEKYLYMSGQNSYELLTQSVTIEIRNTGEVDFKCVPADSSKNYVKYELMQGDEVIAESSSPEFSVPYNDFVQSETVDKQGLNHTLVVKDTSIRLTDSNGEQVSEVINLTAEKAEVTESTISIGMDDEITIPQDDNNIITGWTLNRSLIQVPVTIKKTDTKWSISINVAQDKMSYVENHFKNEFKNGIDLIDQYELVDDMAEKAKWEQEGLMKCAKEKMEESPAKVTFNLIGYAEGDLPLSAGKRDIKVGTKLEGKLKRTREFQKEIIVPVTPPVPVPVAVQIKTNFTASLDTYLKFDPANLGKASWEAKPTEDTTVKGKITYNPGIGAGPGLANIAWVGGYGDVKVSATGYMLPKEKSGLESVIASGGFKVVFCAFGDTIVESNYLAYGTTDIYRRDQTIGAKNISRKAALSALGETAPKYTAQADAGEWTGSDDVLQAQAYSSSAPVLMQSGNDLVLLFVSNTSDRAAADDSVLLYSVYDKVSGSFGEPQPVDDDGFADYSPVAYNGTIAWIHAKKSLDGAATLNEISTATEVKAATFNSSTGKFENIETITNNNDYEGGLRLNGSGNTPVLTWTVNSAGDMTGASGTNTVYTATYNAGSWNVQAASSFSEYLVLMESGKIGGKNCTISITGEGKTLHLNMDGTDKVIAENVAWAGIADNSNKILWLDADGVLYSMTGADGEAVAENTQDILGGNVRQLVEGSNGELAILYTRNGNNCANAYYISYDKANNEWSGEIALTAAGKNEYAEAVSAVFENGGLFLTWNQRTVDATAEDLTGTNTIRKASVSGAAELVASDVSFIKDDVVAGAELPITLAVANQGMQACSSATVEILKGTDAVSSETIDLNLQPGTAKQITHTITLPSEMSEAEYTVKVTDVAGGSSVSKKFTLGSANFSIDREVFRINGKYRIAVTVTNNGYNTGNGRIEFYDYEDPEEVYETADLKYVGAGETYSFETTLDRYDWDHLTSSTIGIRAVDAKGNIDDDRTVYVVDPEAATQISLSLNKTSMVLENPGDTEQLELTVLPSTSNVGIVWKSSNEEVATVDQNGRVTAVANGKAVIKASTEDGSKYIRCAVQVGDGNYQAKTFKVSFNSNGGSGSMDNVTVEAGSGYTLPACGFTAPNGKEFNGWNLGAAGDEIIVNEDVELIAQWKDIQGSGDDPDNPPGPVDPPGFDPYNPGDSATWIHEDVTFEELESAHEYAYDIDEYWYYNAQNSSASSMQITFSANTNTEEEYDYLYIYDGNGKLVGEYTGDELAGQTITVDGNKLAIRVTSDGSISTYGFKIIELKELSSSGEVLAEFSTTDEPYVPDDPYIPDDPTPVNPQPTPIVTPAVPAAPAEIVDLPAVKISKPAAAKKALTVKWKKVKKKNLKKIQGIEIQVATDPDFTNIVKTATAGKKKTSKKIKGLTSKQTYYVRIRAYKNAADGKHVSGWRAKRGKAK